MDLKLLLTTFGLLFLAELGDKTQLSVFTLVAKHKEPLPIFIGAGAALVLVTAIAVVVGQGRRRGRPGGHAEEGGRRDVCRHRRPYLVRQVLGV